MSRTVVLLLVVAGIHGPLALADETAGHDHALAGGGSVEEIRVTAHPLSEIDEHIVRPVQVLSKEELRTRSVSSIGETVANELGVTSSDFGTGVGRPVIRGQSGSRVQVLENGLGTMDASSLSADHSVTTETILSQQVEIFRGPATLLFGSGGSGGIINVVRGRILDYVPDDVEGEVALQYETVSDGMTGAGRLNFGAGNFAFHIDGMARNTDDYNIPGFAEMEPGESRRGTLANSSRKTENISGGLSWVGARGYAGFSVSHYQNEYGIPGHHHHHSEHEHLHDLEGMDGHDDHDHDDEDDHDHDDEDDHDHDEEDEHHDDEDGDHDHDEDEHHDDEDGDHDHDEDEHHDDEDGDHDHDEDEHHDDEDGDHDHDEDEHHDDEDGHHDHDEDEHHDDEDGDHDHDEDEHHDDEDGDHDHDEDEHHDDEDGDHDHDEDEHHDDEDGDHDHDEDEHHDDEDGDHDHDEDEHHDDEDGDHDHDEDEHHDDEDGDHDHDEDEHHDDEDGDHDHDEDEHHDDEDGDHDHEDEDGHDHDDEHEHDDEEEEGGVRIDMEQTRYEFVAALDDPLPGLSRVKLRWGFNDYEHDEIEPNGEIGTAFDNEEVEGRIEFLHNPIGDWNGAVGFHYRHKDFAAVGAESFVLPSELESFGVFILEKTDIGRVHIDLGARFEHQDSNADTGAQNDYDLFSASGGLNWDYAPGYQVGLSFSHSERAPSIEELYAQGPHLATATFEIGDANLDKEKSNNIDVYWRKTTGMFTVTANFFYNRIDDYVYKQEQDLNGDGFADRVAENFDGNPANILDPEDDEEPLLVYLRQDDAEFLGFEAETRVRLMDDNNGRMVLRLWADYVEGERSNDTNLARITPWRFGSGLTWSRGPMYASVNYTRVNEQDDTAPLETRTAGYDLLDLHAGYTFRVQDNTVTLFARASNLLDEEIRRHTSFVKEQAPLPGRSGIFGVRVGF